MTEADGFSYVGATRVKWRSEYALRKDRNKHLSAPFCDIPTKGGAYVTRSSNSLRKQEALRMKWTLHGGQLALR